MVGARQILFKTLEPLDSLGDRGIFYEVVQKRRAKTVKGSSFSAEGSLFNCYENTRKTLAWC